MPSAELTLLLETQPKSSLISLLLYMDEMLPG